MKDPQAGKTRFDRMAAEWDANPVRVALARAVTEAIRETVPLRADMQVMDFGAGTGLVTLALAPSVGRLTAMDTSPDMLHMLEAKLKAQRIEHVRTLAGELDAGRGDYDLVVGSMVLHHIADVPKMITTLAACLKPGGWMALADLETEDGSFHGDMAGVYHKGFNPDEVCGWLREAGLSAVASREATVVVKPSASGELRRYPVFLASGVKTPASSATSR